MTLTETAERINDLFRRYGLDHEVVQVVEGLRPTFQVDQRENEPDPMKWRTAEKNTVLRVTGAANEEIQFIDGHDPERMELLLTTLTYVFDVYFEVQPETGQGRLF